jgi:outer membrane scaffolding protein for murein synthesis (MipA/OmpV family)
LYDVLGVYNGYEVECKLSHTFIKMPFIISPFIASNYQSGNFTKYYYSINKSAINNSYGIFLNQFLSIKTSLSLMFKHTFLDDEIYRSILVNKKEKKSLIISLSYKF